MSYTANMRKTKNVLCIKIEELELDNERLKKSLEKSEKDLTSVIKDNSKLIIALCFTTMLSIFLLAYIMF